MHSLYVLSRENDIFRIPLCSYENLKSAFALTEEELEKQIIDLCNNSFFMEAIFVASPSLFEDLCRLRDGQIISEKKKNEIYLSSYQYFYRMCSRTTPFGLFAAIANNIENTTPKKIIKKTLLLDYEWSWRFSKKIEAEHLEVLCFQRNGMCYETDTNYYVPYSICNDDRSVEKTELTDAILKACKQSINYFKLQNEICEQQKLTTIVQFNNMIHRLLKAGIIISNLTPNPHQRDYMGFVLKTLGKNFSQSKQGLIIQEIRENIQLYENNQSTDPIITLSKITSELSKLLFANRYIQVDATLENGIHYPISQENREKICEAVNLIFDFFSKVKVSHSIYNTYKDLFMNKYGDYRTVPILEMLDPYIGIGVPSTYKTYKKKTKGEKEYLPQYNRKLVRYVYTRIQKAIQEKTTVKIDEEFFCFLSSISKAKTKFPQKIFSGIFCSHDKLGNQKFELNMDLLPTNGELLPFQRIMDFHQMYSMKNNKRVNGNDDTPIICQLQYIPQRIKWTNVMREPLTEQRHIRGYLWDDTPQENINFNDLYVGLENNRFFLFDNKTKERVNVISKNMYSYYNDSDVIRFIKEVNEDNTVQVKSDLFEKYFSLHVYLPEFTYKNITIVPETWCFCENDLLFPIHDFQDFKDWIKQIITQYEIPEIIYYRIGDFGYFINPKHDLSCKMLFKNWKKYHFLTFQKYCFSPEETLFSNNETYRVEMIMSFICNNPEIISDSFSNNILHDYKNEQRYCAPGTDWIFVKLYGVNDENNLIERTIVPWCNQQVKNGYAKKFYFVRYKEEDYQIRVRIQQTNSQKVFLPMIDWLKSLIGVSFQRFEISTYEKELERYGGEVGTEFAETVFYYDSLISSKLINKNDFEKRIAYLSLALTYLEEMYPDIKERLTWITNNSPNRQDYRDIITVHKNTTDNAFSTHFSKENRDILIVLKKTVNNYSHFFNCPLLKARALDGILHMSFNRIFGMNRNAEKEMRALIRYKIYQKYQRIIHMNNKQSVIQD